MIRVGGVQSQVLQSRMNDGFMATDRAAAWPVIATALAIFCGVQRRRA
jgi:hypothetical protein